MIGLAAGLTGARAGITTAQPDEPEDDEPDADRQRDQESKPAFVSDRRGANGGLESPASTAASGAAVLHRTGRRADLGWQPRAAVGAGVVTGVRRGAAFSRGAERTEAGAITRTRPGTTCVPLDRRTAVLGAGSARGRERARFIGAERAPPRRAGRPCCDRGLGRSRRSRGGGSRLGLRSALGKQAQRVEVAVRLSRDSDSEVDVRLVMLDLSARADGADALTLLDRSADPDAHGPEMDERDRIAVLGADRHAEPRMRQRAGERDHAARRCAHIGA